MVFDLAGSLGIGLVWGWLVGTLEGRVQRTLRGTSGAVAATIGVGVTVFGFESWRGLAAFLIAAAVTLFIQVSWRRSLRSGVDNPSPQ